MRLLCASSEAAQWKTRVLGAEKDGQCDLHKHSGLRMEAISLIAPCGIKAVAAGLMMDFRDHVRTTGSALKNWAVAQLQDSMAVGVLWLIGLYILHVPLALMWEENG